MNNWIQDMNRCTGPGNAGYYYPLTQKMRDIAHGSESVLIQATLRDAAAALEAALSAKNEAETRELRAAQETDELRAHLAVANKRIGQLLDRVVDLESPKAAALTPNVRHERQPTAGEA